MKITYNITGPARKELVNAIAQLLAVASVYQGPPSFAYNIGGYTVDKDGNLETPEEATTDDIFRLVDALYAEYEYKPEEPMSELFPEEESMEEALEEPESEAPEAAETAPVGGDAPTCEDDAEEAEEAPESGDAGPETGGAAAESDAAEETAEVVGSLTEDGANDTEDSDDTRLTLSLPREKFSDAAIDRLQALVKSKQSLLKKVFETDELGIIVNDSKIMFPWFTIHDIDGEVDAYAKFIHAIAMRALTSSRISSTERQTDNDKFTMRLFLNSLGFKGEEYKFARRFLVRNLDGNGAWRYGNKPDASGFDLDMPTVFTPAVPPVETTEETEAEAEEESEETNVGNEEEESSDEE